MKPKSIVRLAGGLLLLALAAWMVPSPRLHPRPGLPEIPPFSAADRVALFMPNPEEFPFSDRFGLIQRARAIGAEARVFALGDSLAAYAPTRIYQPAPGPEIPTGYHPDQWPALPPGENGSGNEWQMIILTPEEQAAKNTAVLAAARALRDSGTDDPRGARESALLSRTRRAEIVLPLKP